MLKKLLAIALCTVIAQAHGTEQEVINRPDQEQELVHLSSRYNKLNECPQCADCGTPEQPEQTRDK